MNSMEPWEQDFEWLRVRHFIKDSLSLSELPDLNIILIFVGIQELGYKSTNFTKEEKTDLMHIAVCTLLEPLGYYRFTGRDEDGWPHFEQLKPLQIKGVENQEHILKNALINYFVSYV